MSSFFREYLSNSINLQETQENLASAICRFSRSFLATHGFLLEMTDTLVAWTPIRNAIDFTKLQDLISTGHLETQSDNIHKLFHFIETVNVEAIALAHSYRDSTMRSVYIEEAFGKLRGNCPFPIEGLCPPRPRPGHDR